MILMIGKRMQSTDAWRSKRERKKEYVSVDDFN
jgi:hypothetical protein